MTYATLSSYASVCAVGFILAGVVASSPALGQSLPTDSKPTCTISSTEFKAFFESGAVTLNGIVKPADGIAFPDVPNCSFHKWSQQMFLWVTSPAPPAYGGGGRRVFESGAFFDVSPLDANGDRRLIPNQPGLVRRVNVSTPQRGPRGLPIVTSNRGERLELVPTLTSTRGRQLVSRRARQPAEVARIHVVNGRATFIDRNGARIQNVDLARVPATAPQLKTARLRAPSSLRTVQGFRVDQFGPLRFFDSVGNEVLVEQMQADASVLIARNGSPIYFSTHVNDVFAYLATAVAKGAIATDRFPTSTREVQAIVQFAQANNRDIPEPEAMAVELKASWIEAAGLDASQYITTDAMVPTYDKTDPKWWKANGIRRVKLALIGLHVVGSTRGHPEMIWASFEHVGVAPSASYQYRKANNNLATVALNTGGSWHLTTAGAAGPFNAKRAFISASDIKSFASTTVGPSEVLRINPWGRSGASHPSNTEVLSINHSVRTQLAPGDVRLNYFMLGTTWTIGGAAPTASNQVGTNVLANSSVETFTQDMNCFACHTSNRFQVSHIFHDLKPLF